MLPWRRGDTYGLERGEGEMMENSGEDVVKGSTQASAARIRQDS